MLTLKGSSRHSGQNLNGNRFLLIVGRNRSGFALFQIRLAVVSDRDERYEKPTRTPSDVHQYLYRSACDCRRARLDI